VIDETYWAHKEDYNILWNGLMIIQVFDFILLRPDKDNCIWHTWGMIWSMDFEVIYAIDLLVKVWR
jgi:hypothetical protein